MKELFYSIIYLLLFLVLFIVAWVIFNMVWAIPFHNYRLWVIERQFADLNSEVLPNSKLLLKKAEVSHWGNSNLCDYFVGQFRASSLTKEKIENAYDGKTIKSYADDGNSPLEIKVFTAREDWMEPYFWEDSWEELEDELNAEEHLYLVFASSDSHSPDGDIRCH